MEDQIKNLVEIGVCAVIAIWLIRALLAQNKAQGERLAQNDERNIKVAADVAEKLAGCTAVLKKVLDNEEKLGAKIVTLERSVGRLPCTKEAE